MKIILLDMGEGFGIVIGMLLTIAVILIPVSVGIYAILIRKNVKNLLSSLLAITAAIILSMTILYFESNIYGDRPYESLFDVELIKTALVISSFSTALILIISFLRFLKRK